MQSERGSTRGGGIPDRRFRRRRVGLGLMLAGAVAIPAAVGLAGAAAPSLDERIDAANSDAERLSERVDGQTARIAELQTRAREAGARSMELNADVERSARRSNELADELSAAEAELDRVRAKYKRAVGVLSERLVEIYKGAEPDYTTVLLEASGFDDLQTRAEYLNALREADAEIAERVGDLHDRVSAQYERIADLKAEIDAETARLQGAEAEMARARAGAERSADALARARAAVQSDLEGIESRIAELEAEQAEEAEQQGSSGTEFHGGPYAIPTYIVMCESGGNYRAYNPSSGAGGAYQIIPSTWRAYGGRGLAHQAPKEEQDRIAAMIWRDSGPSAWSCA